MSKDRALIVCPTFNEADNVEQAAHDFLAPVHQADILFVDDNSPDGTGVILDQLAAENARVFVLHRTGKQGLGSAYRAGFRWGLEREYDYFLEMDADFSHSPRYLPQIISLAAAGNHMVVGSRYVAGGGTLNWGAGRKFISRFGGFYGRTILGVEVRDLTAGFICYRRETLERIDLEAISSNGYSFQIETKYRVIQAGMKVVETPIVFEDRRVGQSKMSRAIVAEALVVVWKLRLGL